MELVPDPVAPLVLPPVLIAAEEPPLPPVLVPTVDVEAPEPVPVLADPVATLLAFEDAAGLPPSGGASEF